MLSGFVAELERRDIAFCVLRGAQGFPHLRPGSDIDVAISRESAPACIRAIEEHARREGVAIWERHASAALLQFLLYARAGPGRHEFFGIDLHTAETFFGIPVLAAEEVLRGSRRMDGLPRPAAAQSACIDALLPFLSSGTIPARHAARFREALRQDPAGIEAELARWFGQALARRIRGAAGTAEDLAPALPLLALRAAALRRAFRHGPLAVVLGFARCLFAQRVRPWFRPRGRCIAFLGTDGSGKSTLLAAVLAELERSFPRARHRTFHFRPGLLPDLSAWMSDSRLQAPVTDTLAPHRARPSGRLGSMLRAVYYVSDYLLGSLVRVRPLRRRPALIAFDRYAYDFLVDPLRSRIRRGAPFLEALCRLCPRPDRIFVCTAGYELVRSRKTEVSEDETRAQLAGYEDLAGREARAVLVRTDGPVEDAVDLVLETAFGQVSP